MRISEQSCLPLRWSASVLVAAMLLFILFSRGEHALAVDPPHNSNNSIGMSITCSSCHFPAGTLPSWATSTRPATPDDTYYNNLCTSCHMPSKMTDSGFIVKTHSSQNTSGKYSTWTVECRTCHNPHLQEQVTSYPTDTTANLVSGTVGTYSQPPLTATQTVVPVVGSITGDWTDHTLVPNTVYPAKMFRILSNTANAITVSGVVNVRYAPAGSRFAVRYGKMVKAEIGLPTGGVKAVKFFGASGMNSFGTSTDPANMTSLCQVCHVQTTSFNNSGVLEGPGHPSLQAGGNCTQCHTHESGFKPACGSCHGNPPIVSTQGGPNGLANNEGGTGSTTPGAHGKHVISAGIACDACHENGMPETPIYDKFIQIGFNIANGVYKTGSYDGRASLANGYSYTKGNAGTTVSRAGTKVCANVYCHGSTMAPNGGTDITPVWDDPSTGACGRCHGATALAYPTRGSHSKHVRTELMGYAYPCSTCHRDPSIDESLHVNGRSEVVFSGASASGGTYSGTPAMLDAYGTCTNIYCHSTVQSSPPGGPPVYRTTPAWGQEIWSCGACHDYGANLQTGSHGKHMEVAELQECWACHNYTGIDDGCMACHDPGSIEPKRDLHANHAINVSLTPRYGGNYSGLPAPGDAYGKCTAVYCHSTVQGDPDPLQPPTYLTPTWGQTFSGTCGKGGCHAVGNAHQGDTGYMLLTTGSHSKHLRYKFYQDGNCQSCHYDPSFGGCTGCHQRIANHVNHSIDVAFNPSFPFVASGPSGAYTGDAAPRTPYGGCSDLYCHSPGTKGSPPYSGPNTTAYLWGGSLPADCTGCHNGDRNTVQPMGTGSHGRHIASYPFDCSLCHVMTVSDSRTISTAIYFGNQTLGYRNHSNGWINVAFSSGTSSNGTYAGQASPVTYRAPGSTSGSCGNTYCHSNGTGGTNNLGTAQPLVNDPRPIATNTSATWGTAGPLRCNSCHGSTAYGDWRDAMPFYTSDQPKANFHYLHANFRCNYCHYATTTNGTTITSPEKHANGLYEVVPDNNQTYNAKTVNFTYTYDAGGGKCTSNACHMDLIWGGQAVTALPMGGVGPGCWEMDFFGNVMGGTAPYTYYWNFGDGATSTEQNPVHFYASGSTYTVTYSVRDAKNHADTKTVTPTPQPVNIGPTSGMTATAKGLTVTLTDQSFDPDYNQCGHAGPGTIVIQWGDFITLNQSIDLVSTPSGIVYSHTYQNSGTYTISQLIWDNVGYQVQTLPGIRVTLPTVTTVSGRVTRAEDGSALSSVKITMTDTVSGAAKFGVTDVNGNYASSTMPEERCYTAVPSKAGFAFTPASRTFCTDSGPVSNIDFTSIP